MIGELAQVYDELVRTLENLPAEGAAHDAIQAAVRPFAEKASALHKQAESGMAPPKAQAVTEQRVAQAFAELGWLISKNPQGIARYWHEAWKRGEWDRVAYLHEDMQSRKLVSPSSARALRSLLLWKVGARTESLVEWEQARSEAPAVKLSQGGRS